MSINTLYHLASDVKHHAARLAEADYFLTIADYFNYRFSGVACVEVSNASTTQMYNPTSRGWSSAIIERAGFPAKIFPRIVASGAVLGPLHAEFGLLDAQVIATCSHDTGAAVAAVPAEGGEDWAYLSSGTWSLLAWSCPSL